MEPVPTQASPWSVRDPILIYVGALFASLAGLVIAGVVGFIDVGALTNAETSDAELPRLIMVSAIAQYGAMYLGLRLLSTRKGSGDFKQDFHLHVTSSDWPFFLYGVGLLFVSGLVLTGIFSLLNIEAPTQEVVEAAQATQNLGEKAVILVAIAFLAPVLEEILFRGVFLDALKPRMPLNRAIWITGIVFGLVHLTDPATLALVPALIGLGVILGFVRERGTGALSRPNLMHMGFNAVTAVALVFAL
ncbi:MAG: CPBP family intramembrane metalloprotease [Acidimicrobiia bacterium]|nr:CPBP family intramembrane metalloprotease [Acidimicrobiia bacterium]